MVAVPAPHPAVSTPARGSGAPLPPPRAALTSSTPADAADVAHILFDAVLRAAREVASDHPDATATRRSDTIVIATVPAARSAWADFALASHTVLRLADRAGRARYALFPAHDGGEPYSRTVYFRLHPVTTRPRAASARTAAAPGPAPPRAGPHPYPPPPDRPRLARLAARHHTVTPSTSSAPMGVPP
jgi:hypothetical protein